MILVRRSEVHRGGAPRFAALAVLVPLVAATGCSGASPEATPVVSVQTAQAQQAPIADIVTATAVLYPLQQAAISPKISAPVERFFVQRGERVKKGQVLVVLEHRDLQATVDQDQGLYEQAQANYETTRQASVPADMQKAQLDVATTKAALDAQQQVVDDRQRLLEQGALPQRDLQTARVSLAEARSAYDVAKQHLDAMQAVTQTQTLKAAEAQLASAKGQYEAAQAQLSYATIRSPIDGYVTDRPFYAGETAEPGSPVLTVMDTSSVVARAPVPVAQASEISVGDAATLTVPGDERPVEGRVIVVSPALDPASTTMQVWVQAQNPDGRLKPGTSVRVDIVARTITNAVVVPEEAIVTDSSGARSVMVVGPDKKAHASPVKVGVTEDGRTEITSGLKAGETVVTVGAYGLEDGTEVQVVAPASAPDKGADGK
jgi:HlyD family secretion protein